MKVDTLYSSAEWVRAGRGRGFDIFAGPDELRDWIVAWANKHGYSLTVVFTQRRPGRNVTEELVQDWELPHLSFVLWLARGKVYLRDRGVTPDPLPSVLPITGSSLTASGLIHIDPPMMLGDQILPASIGIVPSIVHKNTGQRVQHTAYNRLFDQLKRFISRVCPDRHGAAKIAPSLIPVTSCAPNRFAPLESSGDA